MDSQAEAFARLVTIARATPKRRDQLMILAGGVLGLDTNGLRGLTVEQARALFEQEPGAYAPKIWALIDAYITKNALRPQDYLFRSERHRGRLERTVVWRIINSAARTIEGAQVGGGITLLQDIARTIRA